MQVKIKDFGIDLAIKNRGIELEVRDTAGKQLGDLVITKTQVIWCPGRTTPKNGKKVAWDRFIEMMDASA
ncbi:MAG: hypothetical protein WD379_10255 [Dehalococcoidia bacterium]